MQRPPRANPARGDDTRQESAQRSVHIAHRRFDGAPQASQPGVGFRAPRGHVAHGCAGRLSSGVALHRAVCRRSRDAEQVLELDDPDICFIGVALGSADCMLEMLDIDPQAEWDTELSRHLLKDFGGRYEDWLYRVGGPPPTSRFADSLAEPFCATARAGPTLEGNAAARTDLVRRAIGAASHHVPRRTTPLRVGPSSLQERSRCPTGVAGVCVGGVLDNDRRSVPHHGHAAVGGTGVDADRERPHRARGSARVTSQRGRSSRLSGASARPSA